MNSAATREQARELDRIAMQDYAIDGLILMENAGRACALAAAQMLGSAREARVVILAGKGNNGGDGYVVARHLANWGARVRVLLLGTVSEVLAGEGETASNLNIILKMGIPVDELASAGQVERALDECAGSDLLVDALLGTGIRGEVRQPYRSAIEALNRSGLPVLAIDVPSGLDCDTGAPMGAAVHARLTVTMAVNKVGFSLPGAGAYTGRVEVAEISIPRAAIERVLGQGGSEGGAP
jgi:hydroxyethylthiazole kinase-like uncharacterized protein yjeF